MEDMDLPDLEPVAIKVQPGSSQLPPKDADNGASAHKRNRKRKRHNTQSSAMDVDVVVEKQSPKRTRWVSSSNWIEEIEDFPNLFHPSQEGDTEIRKISVPSNRYTPIKNNWTKLFEPIVEHLKLQMRFNLKSRNVELRVRRSSSRTFVPFPNIFHVFNFFRIAQSRNW
jgi:hypothetical protein